MATANTQGNGQGNGSSVAQATAQAAQGASTARAATATASTPRGNAAQRAKQALAQAHPYVQALCKVAQANRNAANSMPVWAGMAAQAMGMPNTAATRKQVGRYLRGYMLRSTGNGCGRGNSYGQPTGAQVLAMAGYGALVATAATPQQAQQATAGAQGYWQQAKAKAAQQAQARQAKRNAQAGTRSAS